MFRKNRFLKVLFSLIAFFCISLQSLVVKATDIVATDDVVNGASVFVFRESRKKPQERAGGGVSLGGGRVRSYREKLNAQIADNRRKKAAAAKARAAAVAKAAVLRVWPLGKLEPQYDCASQSSGRSRPTTALSA